MVIFFPNIHIIFLLGLILCHGDKVFMFCVILFCLGVVQKKNCATINTEQKALGMEANTDRTAGSPLFATFLYTT